MLPRVLHVFSSNLPPQLMLRTATHLRHTHCWATAAQCQHHRRLCAGRCSAQRVCSGVLGDSGGADTRAWRPRRAAGSLHDGVHCIPDGAVLGTLLHESS